MDNIYKKINRARVSLQVLNIKKSGRNKYAGFAYYELADFLPHVNEIFEKIGLTAVFKISNDTAEIKIINTDKPEETIEFSTHSVQADLKGCTAIQNLGATHTYLKRYLYLHALEIVENDIADSLQPKEDQEKEHAVVEDGVIVFSGGNRIEISAIKDCVGINATIRHMLERCSNTSWKPYLKKRAEELGLAYNDKKGKFENEK